MAASESEPESTDRLLRLFRALDQLETTDFGTRPADHPGSEISLTEVEAARDELSGLLGWHSSIEFGQDSAFFATLRFRPAKSHRLPDRQDEGGCEIVFSNFGRLVALTVREDAREPWLERISAAIAARGFVVVMSEDAFSMKYDGILTDQLRTERTWYWRFFAHL